MDETCGVVTPYGDLDTFHAMIRHVCEDVPFSREACLKRAEQFDMNDRFVEYVDLYSSLVKEQ